MFIIYYLIERRGFMVDLSEPISVAKAALTKAYSPYSNYSVGVALVCKNGKIYSGCNVENLKEKKILIILYFVVAKAWMI